jgi:hypothetical protein
VRAIATNPYACWNWFGYLVPDFLFFYTKAGLQMAGVHRILERAAGI